MHPRDSRTHRSTTPRTLVLVLALAAVSAVPAVTPAVAQGTATYTLDSQGTSHVAWPFTEPTSEWSPLTISRCHETDDYYAVDWNWGVDDEDRGKTAIAMAPGVVIFAGRNPPGSFGGYGNQVVVHVVDENGAWTDWAYRYAHLDTLAVGDGHYVHFGSEIGTVGDTGTGRVHLHSVLYKNIYDSAGSTRTGLQNLSLGFSPSARLDCDFDIRGPTIFAAEFEVDAEPFWWNSENLPCSTWNDDPIACNSHSIPWGNRVTQDCAYYTCSGRCAPRGTSNCRAGCESYCDPPGALDDPCHTWNGDWQACDAQALQPGGTRDCAYYLLNGVCRPRGTSNCLAGISAFCFQ